MPAYGAVLVAGAARGRHGATQRAVSVARRVRRARARALSCSGCAKRYVHAVESHAMLEIVCVIRDIDNERKQPILTPSDLLLKCMLAYARAHNKQILKALSFSPA